MQGCTVLNECPILLFHNSFNIFSFHHSSHGQMTDTWVFFDLSWWHKTPRTFFLWTYQIFGNFLILCCCSSSRSSQTRSSIHQSIFFKSIQKPLNRDFIPILSWMLFVYAISWPLFFIKVVLYDSFFFIQENHDFCKESCIWFAETNYTEPLNRLTFNTMTFSQKWRHCCAISCQERKIKN